MPLQLFIVESKPGADMSTDDLLRWLRSRPAALKLSPAALVGLEAVFESNDVDGATWSDSTLRVEQVVADLKEMKVSHGVAGKLAPPLFARLAVGRALAPPAAAAVHAAGSATAAGVRAPSASCRAHGVRRPVGCSDWVVTLF